MSAKQIKEAMSDAKQIMAYRDGQVREFCPHMIGWKKGVQRVLGWQFAGYSERGLPLEGAWRCFDVEQLSGVIVRPGPWYRGWTTGRGQQHCIDEIELVVVAELAAEVREVIAAVRRGF